jgi:hypothetical protein
MADALRMAQDPSRHHSFVRSAATLDGGEETYMSLIGKLLAAIVAILWGASLILAGAVGIKPGTSAALFTLAIGTILILLAADQAWRAIRKLG